MCIRDRCGQGLAGIACSMCPIFGTDISLDAANVERLYGKAGFFDCGHSLLGNELSLSLIHIYHG